MSNFFEEYEGRTVRHLLLQLRTHTLLLVVHWQTHAVNPSVSGKEMQCALSALKRTLSYVIDL